VNRFLGYAILAGCIQWVACGGSSDPQLEAFKDGAFVPVAITAHDLAGKRDGATTTATVTLSTENGERLRMNLEIRYNPTPVLGEGSWSFGRYEGGSIRAESVEFAGGQGEGPSLGGVFLLETDGVTKYRVRLPMRPVGTREWTVD